MCPRQIIATCGLVAALAAPSFAVDGVIEINQAAVFAGGITPGDTPGFPATLSQPGSYRLTGNLDGDLRDTHVLSLKDREVAGVYGRT